MPVAVAAAVLVIGACESDEMAATALDAAMEAGPAASMDAAPRMDAARPRNDAGHDADGDAGGDAGETPRARGEYLVRHVAGCMECHTPRLSTGVFDETRLLSGVEGLEDLVPDDPARGAIHSRNLTPDRETGLGDWTDREIENAMLHGTARDGRVLHWTMPYWLYHAMETEDAHAIVAYLRSVPPIRHAVPDREPLPVEPTEAYHLPHGVLPAPNLPEGHPDFLAAERGQYLATAVGICPYCHSPRNEDPALPIDNTRVFMGLRDVFPVSLGTPVPPDSPTILTRNLTPHATGLGDWSRDQIVDAILSGVSRSGLPVCDPMPSTYGGSFLGMHRDDARDIATYLKWLTPRDSGTIEPCCNTCHGMDAGMPLLDAGMTGDEDAGR